MYDIPKRPDVEDILARNDDPGVRALCEYLLALERLAGGASRLATHVRWDRIGKDVAASMPPIVVPTSIKDAGPLVKFPTSLGRVFDPE